MKCRSSTADLKQIITEKYDILTIGAEVTSSLELILCALAVLEKPTSWLAFCLIKVGLIFGALNAYDSITPALLDEFHTTLQSHFLLLG